MIDLCEHCEYGDRYKDLGLCPECKIGTEHGGDAEIVLEIVEVAVFSHCGNPFTLHGT